MQWRESSGSRSGQISPFQAFRIIPESYLCYIQHESACTQTVFSALKKRMYVSLRNMHNVMKEMMQKPKKTTTPILHVSRKADPRIRHLLIGAGASAPLPGKGFRQAARGDALARQCISVSRVFFFFGSSQVPRQCWPFRNPSEFRHLRVCACFCGKGLHHAPMNTMLGSNLRHCRDPLLSCSKS